MTDPGVLVVGSVTADLTATSRRMPRPGETVLGDKFSIVAGGKGGNQAMAAARMGAATFMAGRTGDDQFGALVRSALTGAGVQLDHLATSADISTGVAHIRVDAQAENNIVIVPLANATLGADDVDAAVDSLAGRVRVVLTQMEIPLAATVRALLRGREAGLTTVLDPAPAARLPDDVYPLVDVLTPNESEATVLTGITVRDPDSAEKAGRALVERGCRAVLVTLGASGCLLVGDGSPTLFPAPRVAAIDTTAAGDAFAGVLGSRLAAGDSMAEAIAWASAAGALATTVLGASPSIPQFEQVRALVESRPTGTGGTSR